MLTKKEYQSIGTIRNFNYDSLLVGSSTAENFNNKWFNEAFGATTIKAIKSSGITAQLDYYLTQAFEEREIKNIFTAWICLPWEATQGPNSRMLPCLFTSMTKTPSMM